MKLQKTLFGGWMGGWVGGWVVGWVVIFYPLRCSLFSGMLTSTMCLLQIWRQNLSTAFRSKVMIDLSLKFGNFKADIIVVIWSEKYWTKIQRTADDFLNMIGWVGCDILPPSIFFIFRYVNRLDVLVTNMGVKVVNGF